MKRAFGLDKLGFIPSFGVHGNTHQNIAEIRYGIQRVRQSRLHPGEGDEILLHETDAVVGQRDGEV